MIPAPVMHVLVTMALLCGLTMEPVTPWEPEPADVAMVSRTIWGETRAARKRNSWGLAGASSFARTARTSRTPSRV